MPHRDQAFAFIGTAPFPGTPGEFNDFHSGGDPCIQLQAGTSLPVMFRLAGLLMPELVHPVSIAEEVPGPDEMAGLSSRRSNSLRMFAPGIRCRPAQQRSMQPRQ